MNLSSFVFQEEAVGDVASICGEREDLTSLKVPRVCPLHA
jgi:hypothetical protein